MTNFKYIFFLITLSSLSFCQEKKLGITLQLSNPSENNVSIGWYDIDGESIDDYNLKHNSYSGGLTVNYNLNPETTIRFRYGFTKYFIDEYKDITKVGIQNKESNKGKQILNHFAPGLIWKINKNKFNVYGGFELPFNFHGVFKMNHEYKNTDLLSNNIIDNGKTTIILPQGYSFGLGAIFGFSYFPIKSVSVGAEFSPSLLYSKLSGETTTLYEDYITPTNSSIYHTQDENKGFTFYDQRFSINLTLWI